MDRRATDREAIPTHEPPARLGRLCRRENAGPRVRARGSRSGSCSRQENTVAFDTFISAPRTQDTCIRGGEATANGRRFARRAEVFLSVIRIVTKYRLFAVRRGGPRATTTRARAPARFRSAFGAVRSRSRVHGYNVGGVSNVAAIFFSASFASAYLSSGHTAVSVNSRFTRPLYPMPTTEYRCW